jgi:hypothetical protein
MRLSTNTRYTAKICPVPCHGCCRCGRFIIHYSLIIPEASGNSYTRCASPPSQDFSNDIIANWGPEREGQIASEPAEAPPETRAVQRWKWVFICFGLYYSAFLYGLDNTIAADTQSAVVDLMKTFRSWLGWVLDFS